jgi:BirA family biotin operon repressor/biotin-[acetyl-CoA-carboxylase] ligase
VAIAVSVVLRVSQNMLPQVNMVGTLAVSSLLQTLNVPNVTIKWANDVYVDGKKISGILPEVVWNGNELEGVVLGIGLNVHNDFTGTPIESIATTIEKLTGKTQDRAALIAVLMFHLDKWLDKMGTDEITSAYKAKMVMLGQPIEVKRGELIISGLAMDIRTDGCLLIKQESGEIMPVSAGDVTVVSGR